MLPPPFNTVAQMGSDAFFAGNLTGCTISLAEFGKATVDIKADGMAGIQAAISGEAGVSVSHAKDKEGNWVDTATISAGVSGSLTAKLALGSDPLKLSGLGASGSLGGKLFTKLAYNEGKGEISAMSAGAELSASAQLSGPKAFEILPPSIAAIVVPQIDKVADPLGAKLGIKASISAENLHKLLSNLDSYIVANGGNSSADGVLGIIETHFDDPANVKKSLVVTMSKSTGMGKIGVEGGAEGVSGKGSISLAENETKQLYP